jgi:hypothetical protein
MKIWTRTIEITYTWVLVGNTTLVADNTDEPAGSNASAVGNVGDKAGSGIVGNIHLHRHQQ